jgi:hypothetical protein
VSSGNADELAPNAPERVIGGDHLVDGRPAADAGPILTRTTRRDEPMARLFSGVTW